MEVKNNNLKTRNKKKKTNKNKRLRILVAFLVLFFSAIIGIIASTTVNLVSVYNQNSENKISSFKDIGSVVEDIREMGSPLDSSMNILLMGSDIGYDGMGREDDTVPTRSDTLMLTHVDSEKKGINVLSIPRDTRVKISGRRYYDKINAAHAYGGEQLAMQTVANMSGTTIHRYISLKVGGLVNIVDVLGGVDIYIDQRMVYRDRAAKLEINLEKGWQKLNGEQAHGYVRFRHDAFGDIGRVQRQQKFIHALVDKLLSPGAVFKIPELADVVMKNIDTNLTRREMMKLGYFLKDIKKENIRMVMLPGGFETINGISYWVIAPQQANEVIANMFPDSIYAIEKSGDDTTDSLVQEPDVVNKRLYKLTVLNGTGEGRLAAQAARMYREAGWAVWSVSQASNPSEKTQLIVQSGKTRPLPELKEVLGIEPEIVNASIGDLYTDFTIIVGKDFAAHLKAKQEALE